MDQTDEEQGGAERPPVGQPSAVATAATKTRLRAMTRHDTVLTDHSCGVARLQRDAVAQHEPRNQHRRAQEAAGEQRDAEDEEQVIPPRE